MCVYCQLHVNLPRVRWFRNTVVAIQTTIAMVKGMEVVLFLRATRQNTSVSGSKYVIIAALPTLPAQMEILAQLTRVTVIL